MNFHDLSNDELLVMAGLLKLIVRADHELSSEESEVLARIAGEVGQSRWSSTIARARQRLRSKGDVMRLAETVELQDVRQLIYSVLVEAAVPGGIVDEEAKILEWLAELWNVYEPVDQRS